jgi:exosortase
MEAKVLMACTPMATALAPKQAWESKLALRPSHALWLKVSVITALVGFLFFAVLADMAHDWWTEPALSQGMLLPPVALYFAWVHRKRTFAQAATPDARGLTLTALACVMFVAGKFASEDFTTRISFVVLLAGLIWTFWGFPRLRTLSFPILLLATMVPLPVMLYNSLAAPLQLFASDMASRIAQALGISIFRDGNIIQLAGISLGVEEACSGLNSLSALTVGGLLFGYVLCTRVLLRAILVVAAIPLAIGINIVRVAGTAVLADYNQEFAEGFYHAFAGYVVFVLGMGILYLLARVLHALADPK